MAFENNEAGGHNNSPMKTDRYVLISAIRVGRIEEVAARLDSKVSLDEQGKDGWTLLHEAVMSGHIDIVNLLLERGAKLEIPADEELTPLHIAARNGNEQLLKLLLDRGARIDARTSKGLAPLHLAARAGNTAAVELLLENGAKADTHDYMMPLHFAAAAGHADVARLLLEAGAPSDATTDQSWTALHMAVIGGHADTVRVLLECGASLEAQTKEGHTPFFLASLAQNSEIQKLLQTAAHIRSLTSTPAEAESSSQADVSDESDDDASFLLNEHTATLENMDAKPGWKLEALRKGPITTFASFDVLFALCQGDTPTPMGSAIIEPAGQPVYVIGWNNDLQGMGLGNVIGGRIMLRFIPTTHYPNLLLIVGLDDDQKDLRGRTAYLNGEYHFIIQDASTRVRLYELATAEKFVIIAFNGKHDDYHTFSFNINDEFRRQLLAELRAAFAAYPTYGELAITSCQQGMYQAASAFAPGGDPATPDAFRLFNKRQEFKPAAQPLFWKEYIEGSTPGLA